MDRVFHYFDMMLGTPNKWKIIAGNRVITQGQQANNHYPHKISARLGLAVWKRYQLPRCLKPTSWNLHVSILIPDGKDTVLLGHQRMWLEIHPTMWTSFWRRKQQQHPCSTSWEEPKLFSCHPWRISTLIAEIQACLTSRPCGPYPVILSTQHVSWTSKWWTTNPVISADYTNVTCNRLSRWQIYQQ